MILQALKEYYDRKAADPASGIAPLGWEWKEIARRMGYSPDWVKHMHSDAIRAVEMLKNNEA